jgi:hypothetical protein
MTEAEAEVAAEEPLVSDRAGIPDALQAELAI